MLLSLLAASLAFVPQDVNWPSFRGDRAQGVAEGHPTPTEWDVDSGEGVLWKTEIPGLAHSSPVVWGDKVFLTSAVRVEHEAELSSLYGSPGYGAGESVEDEGPHAFLVYCLDKQTGEILWERAAHEGVPKVKRHPKSTHANPTPACDAERVVAFFASEGLYCYDHDGELQWKVDFGVLDCGAPRMPDYEAYQWGFASSPVLHEGKVIVQCDVQTQSFLTALDAETGEELWRTERDEDPCWGTPTVHENRIAVNGYKHIGGYDLESGAEVWKLVGGGDVPVPTPVVAHERIYITSAHGPLRPIYAIDAKAEGLLTMDPAECEAMVWSNRRGVYMQTLLVYGEELYACSDGGVLTVFDAHTGEERYRERLGTGSTGFSGSPVAADGLVYFTGESGEIHVIRAGSTFERVATNDMGEVCMATPAISAGVLFVRGRRHLFALGTR
jgi:outer membrane protein assembly factor BamB